jgi:hypothetical protein
MDTTSSPVTITRPRASCLTDLSQQMIQLAAGDPNGTPVRVERLMREGGIAFGDPDFPTTEDQFQELARQHGIWEFQDHVHYVKSERWDEKEVLADLLRHMKDKGYTWEDTGLSKAEFDTLIAPCSSEVAVSA